jgi:uncharacterized pyridoxal phosphate-containing UPF0001 family protein
MAVKLFDFVKLIDQLETAAALNGEAGKQGKRINILLEVNTSGEPAKFGFS